MTTPWEPPLNGTEAEHLVGMLERQRWTFRWKVDGLTIEQLRTPLPSSRLTLGGLLRHLACCEDDIFSWRMHGERPVAITACPEGRELDEWMFAVDPDDTAEGLCAFYDEAVARSRERLARVLAEGSLDGPGHLEFEGTRPSKRRHLCDFVEEMARHTGHADLLREAIDGRVGEDPDEGWRPAAAR